MKKYKYLSLITLIGLGSCADLPKNQVYVGNDAYNEAVTTFNITLAHNFILPMNKAYQMVVPKIVQKSIVNVSSAVGQPINATYSLMDGDVTNMVLSLVSMPMNLFEGAGVVNVSKHLDINPEDKSLSQILRNYGAKDMYYFQLPLLGPQTMLTFLADMGAGSLFAERKFNVLSATYFNKHERTNHKLPASVEKEQTIYSVVGNMNATLNSFGEMESELNQMYKMNSKMRATIFRDTWLDSQGLKPYQDPKVKKENSMDAFDDE